MHRKEFGELDPYKVLGVSLQQQQQKSKQHLGRRHYNGKSKIVNNPGHSNDLTHQTRHPDKQGSVTQEQLEHAELEFKKVAWAYEILSKDSLRAEYSSYSEKWGHFADDTQYGRNSAFNFWWFWEQWESSPWSTYWDNHPDGKI